MSAAPNNQERRRTKRRPIVESFSLFAAVPKKGPFRLRIQDVSEHGVGLDIEADEPEELKDIALKSGETIELHFYLNPTLFLPLKCKVVRLEDKKSGGKLAGLEFTDTGTKAHGAYLSFVTLLDKLLDSAQLAS